MKKLMSAALNYTFKAPLATIPMDVIHSCILPRLPAKSLLRFKSVSKSWQTIISSPEFIHIHYRHHHALSSDANHLFVFKKGLTFHIHELDSPLVPSLHCYDPELAPCGVGILASCEFFLLISVYHDRGLALLNPSTGRYYKIPYPPYPTSNDCYGMYLDEANHDYKVVIGVIYYREAMVYSLKTNRWRLIERRLDDKCYRIAGNSSAVICHLFHIVFGTSSQEPNAKKRIGCFDILAEKWTNDVFFPHINDFKLINVSVLDGLLCVTTLKTEETGSSGNWGVWVMKEYGVKESWFRLMSIASKDILYRNFYPIAYRKGSRHEVFCREIDCSLYIWYNIRENKATIATLNGVIIADGY